MGALRAARTSHQRERAIALGLLPDPSTTAGTVLVISTWNYHGRGHPPTSIAATGKGLADEDA